MDRNREEYRADYYIVAVSHIDMAFVMREEAYEECLEILLERVLGALEPLPRMLQIILPQVEEYASQLLQILPVQLLANALAEEKQIPVGVFRWGSKIMTRE